MSKVRIGARVLLGLAFAFFALNGFFQFLTPPPLPGAAGTFMAGLLASGYIFPVLAVVELAAGLMLLSGRFVPLALVLLAPILVNIIGFHVMLDLPGIGPGAVLTAIALFLAWSYRDSFRGLLSSTPTPSAR